ncbi:hypothetical protein J6590_011906 [Homalodisca vitripennis]|nr:hypothetical protein J6590_011906 [Homalodisca vitripennis]
MGWTCAQGEVVALSSDVALLSTAPPGGRFSPVWHPVVFTVEDTQQQLLHSDHVTAVNITPLYPLYMRWGATKLHVADLAGAQTIIIAADFIAADDFESAQKNKILKVIDEICH